MTSEDSEPYDYDAARRAASESWLKEQVEERLTRFLARRPPVFAAPGQLQPDVAAWLDKFVEGQHAGLILVGNIGAGKSWSLWKIGEELIRRGFLGGIEIKAAHELKRIIAPPVDEDLLKRLTGIDLLALDDVGSIRVSDWDADNLMALVDSRWSQRLPTIVASNNPKLRELLGERVSSRLADGAVVVKMTGADRRRGK